ncbi:MAG: class I SAM-dependent methyltransferase [Deltaproteobacteria bacterium]|nr:class I SAM-dependent methyltransferase [Deltaproteobacteria bacterium]
MRSPRARPILVATAAAALVGGVMAWAAGVLAISSPVPSPTHVPFAATSRHPFDDVAHWASVFDDPARDVWQKPRDVVGALGLRPGMTVADLGAGTGYFSRYLSAAVGETGTVFAVETEPNLLARLRERAEQEQTANVTPILASFDDSRLPAGAVDVVLIVDTFHHLDRRLEYLTRLRRVLKPRGRVAIVDWQATELPVGPPMEHKIARADVIAEMQAAGYRLTAEPAILPYQYVLVFTAA